MMKGAKGAILTVLLLWFAGGFQGSVAPHLAIGGVMPDFLLIVLGCVALGGTRKSGSVTGFFAGLIQGAVAGANIAQYALSRTLVGFFVGWFSTLEYDSNATVALVVVAFTTLTSQLLLMFMAPPPRIFAFLLATIGSAIYNGVLAMPLFALLKRVMDPPSR